MYFDNSELNEAQLKIYYTFLSADGVCGKEELEKLDSICQKMDIDKTRISEIVYEFTNNSIPSSSSEDMAITEIPSLATTIRILEEQSSYSTILTDKSVQTNIIWNLINLGYSDTSFSDPEKRIVKHLASRWNIDDVIVADLIDTAETMLSICEQKEWLKTTKQPYDTIDGKIRELDQVMKHLAENVEITVSESEIA
ncbi:MAG: hypothetical protein ACOYB8_11990 [Eubacteriaceae bacterium]|jgi:hypothetical protein